MTTMRKVNGLAATLALTLATISAPAAAEDLIFTLHNQSSYDIVEFYSSPSDVGVWEEDILGLDILPSGHSVDITIADGREQCEYDFRMVIDDGRVTERAGVDLCEVESYTLFD